MTAHATQLAHHPPGWWPWTDSRALRASLGSGLLGGLCAITAAITTAAGLGAAGFFPTAMDRYQIYFLAGTRS